jgi:acyl-coenzyme A synthetase/AMP-(fatty) acid ligase
MPQSLAGCPAAPLTNPLTTPHRDPVATTSTSTGMLQKTSEVVMLVDELPRTPAGKIQKFVLRTLAADEPLEP